MKNITTFKELLAACEAQQLTLGQAALAYEMAKSGNSEAEVRTQIQSILDQMEDTINNGLFSEEKSMSGLSGGFSKKLMGFIENNEAFMSPLFHKLIAYALATLEENSRMRRIVACPTAGGSGSVPAVLIALKHERQLDNETLQNALLAAGLVGQLVSKKMHLSGAAAGCQAEVGVASGMAAAAIVDALNGDPKKALAAVCFTFQNFIGLVCDPVAGLVEVPCVNRNGIAAVMSAAGATMALSGIPSFLPLDEIIDAMASVGRMMSPKLKESAEGGLAMAPTAVAFTKTFNKP